jgi:hypothetical protein
MQATKSKGKAIYKSNVQGRRRIWRDCRPDPRLSAKMTSGPRDLTDEN